VSPAPRRGWFLGAALGIALVLAIGVVGYAAYRPSSSAPLLIAPTGVAVDPSHAAAAPASHPAADGGADSVATVDPQWVTTYSVRTGIPAPALTAYADAALRAPCNVGWTTLAGIGWVESANGTVGGRQLNTDGLPTTPIRGPSLSGVQGLAAIPRASGHGWQQALGPMQFLPSTWHTWATDGDGNGIANPQDVDDAAAAAARYLCASGADLQTGGGWSSAVFSYNHSQRYVQAVYDAAETYAQRASS
jgi:membrane-bound lytic murein transglycosylase B